MTPQLSIQHTHTLIFIDTTGSLLILICELCVLVLSMYDYALFENHTQPLYRVAQKECYEYNR